ncbi:MAG TPA: FCD domain-containing protein [Polyangiaceae bacterium]|jgi:DNA-binding FadR family transcriptional regulator
MAPLSFQTVSRSSLYMEVAAQIRAAILDGSMSSGDRLPPERELARQFQVGRATIREALRHLQAQGLLAARGRTSPLETAGVDDAASRFGEALSHVVRLQEVSLADLVELRVSMETTALVRAAAAPRPGHLQEAHDALARMERADVQAGEFYEADVAFHLALVAAAGNQALLLVMRAVKDAVRLHLGKTLSARSLTKVRARIVDEHRAILRSVERGEGEAAATHLRRHLSGFYGT